LNYALSLEGHEDWVRCLAITQYPTASSASSSKDILLATGSQDNYIRLWRISLIQNPVDGSDQSSKGINGLDMLDDFERTVAGEFGSGQLSTKAHILSVSNDNE
jgi:elongator complex protein 2